MDFSVCCALDWHFAEDEAAALRGLRRDRGGTVFCKYVHFFSEFFSQNREVPSLRLVRGPSFWKFSFVGVAQLRQPARAYWALIHIFSGEKFLSSQLSKFLGSLQSLWIIVVLDTSLPSIVFGSLYL